MSKALGRIVSEYLDSLNYMPGTALSVIWKHLQDGDVAFVTAYADMPPEENLAREAELKRILDELWVYYIKLTGKWKDAPEEASLVSFCVAQNSFKEKKIRNNNKGVMQEVQQRCNYCKEKRKRHGMAHKERRAKETGRLEALQD